MWNDEIFIHIGTFHVDSVDIESHSEFSSVNGESQSASTQCAEDELSQKNL